MAWVQKVQCSGEIKFGQLLGQFFFSDFGQFLSDKIWSHCYKVLLIQSSPTKVAEIFSVFTARGQIPVTVIDRVTKCDARKRRARHDCDAGVVRE